MKKFINKKNAFTLSELLITMSIVGIIAILTVPNVVRNIFKDSYHSKALATQENIQKAVKNYILSERLVDLEGSALFSNKGSFLNNYLKVTKDCGSTGTDCFAASYKISSSETEDLSGLYSAQDKYYTLMNSGAALGLLTGGDVPSNHVYAIVDANGKSAPNVFCVDMYAFGILPDGNVTDLSCGITIAMGNEGGDDYQPENPPDNPPDDPPDNPPDNPPDDPEPDPDPHIPNNVGSVNCYMTGLMKLQEEGHNISGALADYDAYCGPTPSGSAGDTWAGAKKACEEMGMHLPSASELESYLNANYQQLDWASGGTFYTSEEWDSGEPCPHDSGCAWNNPKNNVKVVEWYHNSTSISFGSKITPSEVYCLP